MWSLKSWCSLVLKILLFSRMVCYTFQVIWSEVERTNNSRVWCYVCPLLVSWVSMFRWGAGWGCDVMPPMRKKLATVTAHRELKQNKIKLIYSQAHVNGTDHHLSESCCDLISPALRTTRLSYLQKKNYFTGETASLYRPVSQIRVPPGGLSQTSGKLWQDYSNCYMFWT